MLFNKISKPELEKGMSPGGGYDAAQLTAWGVKLPPAKGWKKRLMRGLDPNNVNATKANAQAVTK